ncbi:hypothetical protein ARMSODRAFT_1052720 [Armillaria solidipes]|uniref:Uncharacterized protein n=1 Tax=Armillaria solidipes TaxID=1076256 RepID=A0A2H3B2W1_9AGAR|nr:hypothetical protein ARMSODRAFT_1052720 [Armillaria solidipes]
MQAPNIWTYEHGTAVADLLIPLIPPFGCKTDRLGGMQQEDKTLSATELLDSTQRSWAVLFLMSTVTALLHAGTHISIYSSSVYTDERPTNAPYKYPDSKTCMPYATSSSQVLLPIVQRPINCVFPSKYPSLGTISCSTPANILRQLLNGTSSGFLKSNDDNGDVHRVMGTCRVLPSISKFQINNCIPVESIAGLLDQLNTTLRTLYMLKHSSLSSILKTCISGNYDFGIACGHLCPFWYSTSGYVYHQTEMVVYYFCGLGGLFGLTMEDLDSPRFWLNRAWTLQEISRKWIIGRIMGGGTVSTAQTVVEQDHQAVLHRIHKQLGTLVDTVHHVDNMFDLLVHLHKCKLEHAVDHVVALILPLRSKAILTYDVMQSVKDLRLALVSLYMDVRRDEETNSDWYSGVCIEEGRSDQWKSARAPSTQIYWVAGRRLPEQKFEKVAVFTMTETKETQGDTEVEAIRRSGNFKVRIRIRLTASLIDLYDHHHRLAYKPTTSFCRVRLTANLVT